MKTHFFKINFTYIVIALFLTVAGCSGCGYVGTMPEETQVEPTHFDDGTVGELTKTKRGDTISYTRGRKDDKGFWHGECVKTFGGYLITKTTYIHGMRHGTELVKDTKTGETYYNCYNMDKIVKCQGNIVSNIANSRSDLNSFKILEEKYPWYILNYLLQDQNIRDSFKLFMTAIEKKLNTYTLNNDNFDTYFDEEDASESILDSFSGYSNWYQLSGRFASGENEARNFEFRRAVIERYTKNKAPIAEIIQVQYRYFRDQLEKEFGVTSAAFKTFCTEFDTKMDKKINIPVGDPFFIDSLDSWMGQIFSDYMNDDNNLIYAKLKILFSESIKSVKSGNRYDLSPKNLVSEYLESSLTDTLPVHEAILVILFTRVLEVDAVKRSIKEACLTAQKVPILPEIVTNILSENTEGVKVRGLIVFDGNDPITKSGIVWDTVYNPELTPNNINNTGNKYDFTADIKGLVKGKRYFVRSYAVNKAGTAYGNTMEFIAGSVSSSLDTKLSAIDWKVYPNPADDQISITLKESIPVVDISVYSITGHKVFQNRYRQTEEIKIASGDWPAGTYTIVLNGSNIRQTKSVVIQR
jgi:hypothetical protein